ncbi:alpha/beta hydrolase [Variovorax sp. LjRoot175]|uniref:alpha/beta hydrolase n=1 Tax=Variovorax sp. LjRoot175 TaxID=3342276 RepID=UPI003ECC8FFC
MKVNVNQPASTQSAGDAFVAKCHEVRVIEDLTYAMAGIQYTAEGGAASYRALQLDVYEPVDDGRALRPALVMACGGAFTRGDRKSDVVPTGEVRNTSASEYCREFARRGYVCFAIDYRLMQEAPDPGWTPTLPPGTLINSDRVNFVRAQEGLMPCTPQMMNNTYEAAADDISQAVAFVRASALRFRIDASRIALAGFSAGATAAMNAAYAQGAGVAAVVALSGRIMLSMAESCILGAPGEPPLLLFVGENDLPSQLQSMVAPVEHIQRVGLVHQLVRIPGANHFYPRTVDVHAESDERTTLESLMALFLHQHLRLSAMR